MARWLREKHDRMCRPTPFEFATANIDHLLLLQYGPIHSYRDSTGTSDHL